MNRTTMTRIGWVLGGLVVLALVAAGAFWAGTRTSGAWIGGPAMMQQYVNPDAQGNSGVQNMPGYQGMWNRGFGGMPMMGRGGWGFSPFGLIFGGFRVLLFIGGLFLVFALFRRLFFGWGGHGPWRGHGPEGFEARARERFETWHKEAHTGETPTPPAN